MSSMSVSLASAFVPCAAVAYAVEAVAAAVPNVGLPVRSLYAPENNVGLPVRSLYAPENNVGLPVRSLYAPLVATVAKSPGCVADAASVPCAAVAYAD